MNRKEMLRQQFGLVYRAVEANTAGISQEESIRQPSPGGNCANWILAHLVQVQNGAMGLAGAAPVWTGDELESVGDDPITGPDEALDFGDMRARLLDSKDRLLEAIEGLSPEQLDEEMDDPFGDPSTRGGILSLLAFHQAYHAGQLGLSRRLAGHPGAIRGPGRARAEV